MPRVLSEVQNQCVPIHNFHLFRDMNSGQWIITSNHDALEAGCVGEDVEKLQGAKDEPDGTNQTTSLASLQRLP